MKYRVNPSLYSLDSEKYAIPCILLDVLIQHLSKQRVNLESRLTDYQKVYFKQVLNKYLHYVISPFIYLLPGIGVDLYKTHMILLNIKKYKHLSVTQLNNKNDNCDIEFLMSIIEKLFKESNTSITIFVKLNKANNRITYKGFLYNLNKIQISNSWKFFVKNQFEGMEWVNVKFIH